MLDTLYIQKQEDKILSYSSNPELWINSVALTFICVAVIILIGYYLPKQYKSTFTKFLGILFFVRLIFLHGYMVGIGDWSIVNSLPLHLCGINSIICIIIMFRYNQSLFEYLVLLGIPSAFWSILTPQFINGWDGYYFPEFYFSHGIIFLAPLYLSINFSHKLRIDAWKTAFYNGLFTAFCIGIINIIINYSYVVINQYNEIVKANYMYICKAPIADNPLLFTNEWPYYFLMLIFFVFIHILIIFNVYKLIGKVESVR
tara:strand:+ start:317 stop:1090 length:774 start_codon:yes stop_codon:yes gene_type:complete